MTGNSIYTPTVSSDYIYHYGIKGMKWGIRRTAEQLGHKVKSAFSRKKKKSGESDESFGSSKKIKGSVTVKGTAKSPSTTRTSDGSSVEERKAKVLASRSAKELYENADLFTTQELQSAYNRLVLEKNIKNLAPKEVSKGKKMLDKYVDTANNISNFLNSTNKVLSQLNRFKNIVDGGNKKSDKSDKSKNDSGSNDSKKKKQSNDSVEADSYETPKKKKKKSGSSTQDKVNTAKDFVNNVSEVYSRYTDANDKTVKDGMDFAFEVGDRFFNSGVYGLLGSGGDDRKKR